jgi:hypothetical protein
MKKLKNLPYFIRLPKGKNGSEREREREGEKGIEVCKEKVGGDKVSIKD